MATIDELERLDREIQAAEQRALHNLAAHLRDAVRDMPSESKLALAFVRHAKVFDLWAGGPGPDVMGESSLMGLLGDAGEVFRDRENDDNEDDE